MLYDDRAGKVSPGVKFKDAELIGVPDDRDRRPGARRRHVEVKDRRTGERTDVPSTTASTTSYGVVRGGDVDAVIFDWGGTLTRWHDIDFHAESLALAPRSSTPSTTPTDLHARRLHEAGRRCGAEP